MWRAVFLCALPVVAQASAAMAESLVAARTIPARTVIAPEDVMTVDAAIDGALPAATLAIGQEARTTIHAGRAVRAADLGAPALVERNATVTLVFRRGGLSIRAEGRALARAAEGETVRVLNLASKTTVSGLVLADGQILVGDQQ
jgi:flagellar basal body P-ring formation protein FlgA